MSKNSRYETHAFWQELIEELLPDLRTAGLLPMVPPYTPGETPRLWVAMADGHRLERPVSVDLEPLRRCLQRSEKCFMRRRKGDKRTRLVLENRLLWRCALIGQIYRVIGDG